MDDAERVRLGERRAGLHDQADRALDRQRDALVEDVLEIGALEELHRHEVAAVRQQAGVEQPNRVRAAQSLDRRDLAREPLLERGDVLLLVEHLDRDRLAGGGVDRPVDAPHASRPHLALDAIASRQDGAGTLDCGRNIHCWSWPAEQEPGRGRGGAGARKCVGAGMAPVRRVAGRVAPRC